MHPILFHLGPVPIMTYGVLLAAGFLLAIGTAALLAPRWGMEARHMWNVGLVVLACGIVGGRLLGIAVEWIEGTIRFADLTSLHVLRGAGVFYGGLIAASLGSLVYTRVTRISWWQGGDAYLVGVALGHGIGRLGCFFSGCCWGKPCDFPWAVTFTDLDAHRLFGVPLNVPLHPTQVYDTLAELLIFGFLLWLYFRKRFHGQIACLYFLLYAVARFGIEFLRDDPRGVPFGWVLSTSQWISIGLAGVFVPLYFWRARVSERPVRPGAKRR